MNGHVHLFVCSSVRLSPRSRPRSGCHKGITDVSSRMRNSSPP